ncbi:cation-transporting P-type ATPase [Aeromonas sp. FDAARGOS 1419]|uniref:cation-transporting P-type ATPase n=1 Tax=Aeromonas sp. FDAARGOS 1419 TaxID=2778068 RepID=UPI001C237DB9|nr:cation-transporting P-type ATPase [Aeromonas sp. FDAARGOS 1419]QWZ78099.1 cation-transporting P-type ATPase [Aeromonas sp. FDAARGOS 1419]
MNKELIISNKLRRDWHQLSASDTLNELESSHIGLATQNIPDRNRHFGKNRLPEKARQAAWLRFLAHFNDVLIYILIGACILTALMGHWVDTCVILGVVLINAAIGFFQESSAEKSLQGIRGMLSSRAHVLRDGALQDIDAEKLVPGDIVSLRPGDRIPADLRLFEVHNLRVEEAILTGESTVVDKHIQPLPGATQLGDRLNMAYSGTMVSSGTAKGIVVAIGNQTELGHINSMLAAVQKLQTPLLAQMERLGKGIFRLIAIMMVSLFAISLLIHTVPLPELLLSLISLAVASVPEGLPAIISIILSLGVQSMARKKAIIRNLPTVETLGAMTVICSDKTGTLTMNEMTVKAVVLAEREFSVDGDSYDPVGYIRDAASEAVIQVAEEPVLSRFIATVQLCNDSQLQQNEAGQWLIIGAPTAGALQVLAAKSGLSFSNAELLDKIPFDSSYKYQANLQRIDGELVVLITGAPDVLFEMACTQQGKEGEQPFCREYWETVMARYASKGLRMVAAAFKRIPADTKELTHADLANDVKFLGVAAMMDPPRPEAIRAIATCQQAGIRVKMITGDHPETAMAIGAMLGMPNTREAVTGAQLQQLSDDELIDVAECNDIFARTSPEHKLRLVKALQSRGHVVGMTGDGVNDAPALKQANVGIAMGIKGTEVTKEAADMVLVDDNFASIASAVSEGRRVYDNLKKTILFALPTNLAQGLLIVIALLLGTMIPLTPLQILWMNMATSTTLAFGLAFEPSEPGMMRRKPRSAKASILDGYGLWRIALVGVLIAGGAFWLEAILLGKGHSDNFISTVLLQMLVTAQWAYMFNCREQTRFSLNASMFRNKGLWLASVVLLMLQLAIIYLPAMNRIFSTEPLPFYYWGMTLMVGFVIFAVIEFEKWLVHRGFGNSNRTNSHVATTHAKEDV